MELAIGVVFVAVILFALGAVVYKMTGRPGARRLGPGLASAEVSTVTLHDCVAEIRTARSKPLTVDIASVKGIAYYRPILGSIVDKDLCEALFFDADGHGVQAPGWHSTAAPDDKRASQPAREAAATLRQISSACPWWRPVIVRGYTAYRWAKLSIAACLVVVVLAGIDDVIMSARMSGQGHGGRSNAAGWVAVAVGIYLVSAGCTFAWRRIVRAQVRGKAKHDKPSAYETNQGQL